MCAQLWRAGDRYFSLCLRGTSRQHHIRVQTGPICEVNVGGTGFDKFLLPEGRIMLR